MAARLSALLPRLAALTVIWLLATSTITFAAAGRNQAATTQNAPKKTAKTEQILVVPDVRRQAYVFAKGILEDGGFAWRVDGGVQGYAANIVARQYPAPGTKIMDTGRPTIVLRLERNGQYAERGLPENASAEPGTAVVLVGGTPAPAPAKPKTHKQAPKPTKHTKPATKAKAAPAKRTPAFGGVLRRRRGERRHRQPCDEEASARHPTIIAVVRPTPGRIGSGPAATLTPPRTSARLRSGDIRSTRLGARLSRTPRRSPNRRCPAAAIAAGIAIALIHP